MLRRLELPGRSGRPFFRLSLQPATNGHPGFSPCPVSLHRATLTETLSSTSTLRKHIARNAHVSLTYSLRIVYVHITYTMRKLRQFDNHRELISLNRIR